MKCWQPGKQRTAKGRHRLIWWWVGGVKPSSFLKACLLPAVKKGTLALIDAAKDGDSRHIKVLLEAGVPTDQSDRWGWNPLHYAVENGKQDDVIRLLASEQAVDAQTPSRLLPLRGSQTPLHLANEKHYFSLAKTLLECNANPGVVDNREVTPLHQMLKSYPADQLEALYPLLKKHLPELINRPDGQNNTPLQHLRSRRDIPVELVTLFSQGAQRVGFQVSNFP